MSYELCTTKYKYLNLFTIRIYFSHFVMFITNNGNYIERRSELINKYRRAYEICQLGIT